jgi:hypothetical protein
VPSSSSRVGSLLKGLSACSSLLVVVIATGVRTSDSRSTRPSSCAAIMTLRTNGERGDQCNFMDDVRRLL